MPHCPGGIGTCATCRPVSRGRAAEVVHGWRGVDLHRPQRASAQNAALTAVGVYMTHVRAP